VEQQLETALAKLFPSPSTSTTPAKKGSEGTSGRRGGEEQEQAAALMGGVLRLQAKLLQLQEDELVLELMPA
jgi:hypothetical protein